MKRLLFAIGILVTTCGVARGQTQNFPSGSGGSGGGAYYGVGGGTAQAQTVTTTPQPGTLAAGMQVCWTPMNNNTATAPTLAWGTFAAKPITKVSAGGVTALIANDLASTAINCGIYDGTEYQLQNPQAGLVVSSSVQTGSAPCSGLVSGTSGNVCLNEGTAPVSMPAASDTIYATTGHCLDWIYTTVDEGCFTGNAIFFSTTIAGNNSAATYSTQTKCAAVGSGANPSVAACAAAPAGVFSCAVAGAGNCTVHTTAMINANSTVIVTQDESTLTGTLLGVTCNVTPSAVNEMNITAKVAATSFSFAITGPVTNPDCFQYYIIN